MDEASSERRSFSGSCKESDVGRSEGWDVPCSIVEGPVPGRCPRFKRNIMLVSRLTSSLKSNDVTNDHCLMLLFCLTRIKSLMQEYQMSSAAELGLVEVHRRLRIGGASV